MSKKRRNGAPQPSPPLAPLADVCCATLPPALRRLRSLVVSQGDATSPPARAAT